MDFFLSEFKTAKPVFSNSMTIRKEQNNSSNLALAVIQQTGFDCLFLDPFSHPFSDRFFQPHKFIKKK